MLRTPWWAILAVGLAVAGCDREEAPDYEGMESRLLTDALDGLRSEGATSSLSALRRLADVDPDSRLPDLAVAHERDRELVVRLNQQFRAGELAEASRILRHQQRYGDMGTIFMAWRGLPDALRAVQLYVAAKPYKTSAAVREALARLDGHRELLDRAPAFVEFLKGEEVEISGLVAHEREQVAESLFGDLDQLVLVGDPNADRVLAQIVATVGPQHPLLLTVEAVARGDWRTVREVSESASSGMYQSEYLEIAFALFWDDLPGDVRQALGKGLVRLPPCTLSGLLLHARYAASDGRMDDAVAYLRELSSSVRMTPKLVWQGLESFVLPRQAFAAPCWQTPCPSVGDLLGRIDQLRAHLSDPGRPR